MVCGDDCNNSSRYVIAGMLQVRLRLLYCFLQLPMQFVVCAGSISNPTEYLVDRWMRPIIEF